MGASVRYSDANENVSKVRSRENTMRPGTGFAALFRHGPLLFLDAPGAGAAGPLPELEEQPDPLQIDVGDLDQFVAAGREQPVNSRPKAS